MSTEMPSPLGQVLDSLRARGLVPAEGSAPVLRESSRPWFVSLLLGAAGWLAGLVLLIFLGSVFRPEANATFIILGILLIGGARQGYLEYSLPDAATMVIHYVEVDPKGVVELP